MAPGSHTEDPTGVSRPGRKRDPARDAEILEATLAVLAEAGYERLTVDKVAARAGAARATVYRRWPTKADLVVDAVERSSRADVDLEHLPDTGSLREDMVAMILPLSDEEQQFRMKILAGVLSLSFAEEPRLTEAAATVGVGPWTEAIEVLLRRAVSRGEFPPADVTALAPVIPLLCLSRAAQQQPITREFSLTMIDGVVLPAMRGGRRPATSKELP